MTLLIRKNAGISSAFCAAAAKTPRIHACSGASFQRLRHLKQLGLGHVTYPNATHSRLAHSLGVLAIMSRVLRSAADTLKLSQEKQQDLRLAALLHDIGHYPYSHLMERLGDVVLTEDLIRDAGAPQSQVGLRGAAAYPGHEDLGQLIVTTQRDLRRAIGGKTRARRIADLFTRSSAADPQLSKLLPSSLDMDRLDYLTRDARAAGVPYGEIDVNYLLRAYPITPAARSVMYAQARCSIAV